MTLSKSEKLKRCKGCRDNFYNGNNPHGIEECWQLDSAEPTTKKKVGIWDSPPWIDQPVIETLSCYRPDGFVMVEPSVTS